jgi:hypothetical protein
MKIKIALSITPNSFSWPCPYLQADRLSEREENTGFHLPLPFFTLLESPSIDAEDGRNRKQQLLI